MADLRINALATTAATSASDDFLPIDGATNNTRKLSAYSPTFGGNLTVSGTTAMTGNVAVNTNKFNVTAASGNTAIAGDLTVSGTGTHTFGGPVSINVASGDIQYNLLRSSVNKGIIAVPGSASNIVADSAADDLVVRTTSGKTFRVTTDGGSNSALTVTQALTTVAGNLTVSGTGTHTFAGPVRLKGYTVATLPAGTQGDTAFVTDATAPTYLGALTGGGAVVCTVFYNGSAWVSA